MAQVYGVAIEWLVSGTGEPFSQRSQEPNGGADAEWQLISPEVLWAVLSEALRAPPMTLREADSLAADLLQIARLPPDRNLTVAPQDQARLRAATVISLKRMR
jgi:hypothetical protein